MVTLVDGNNILHSTFHAVKQDHTLEGILKAILQRFQSFSRTYENLILVFDGHDARKEQQKILASYKSARGELVPEAVQLFDDCLHLLRGLGFTVVQHAKYEADQIIGSLTKSTTEPVLIISNDKDFNQLINARVTVFDPRLEVLRDREYVIKRYQVTPQQYAFYLTLVGDVIDGVSGLPGCGKVGAVKLIKRYRTFKRAIIEIGESSLRDRMEQQFMEHLEHLYQCYRVVKLRKLPETFTLTAAVPDPVSIKALCIQRNYSHHYLLTVRRPL